MQLVRLPRTPSIASLLDQYRHTTQRESACSDTLAFETIHGLRTYFHHSIGTRLLYPFERQQVCDGIMIDGGMKGMYEYG